MFIFEARGYVLNTRKPKSRQIGKTSNLPNQNGNKERLLREHGLAPLMCVLSARFDQFGTRFQVKVDLFGDQGCHGNKSFPVPAGAALFLPPPVSLLTVAQARASAIFVPTPFFRNPSQCVPPDVSVCQYNWIYRLETWWFFT
ncbi:MAG: hypothetical protein ABR955_06865 [Verrucomicrobiota bacterium]|jgi:hypothetical protein